jgi:hypothetical protein
VKRALSFGLRPNYGADTGTDDHLEKPQTSKSLVCGEATSRRDAMAGCALTQTNQQEPMSMRTPLLMAMKKVLEVSESQG